MHSSLQKNILSCDAPRVLVIAVVYVVSKTAGDDALCDLGGVLVRMIPPMLRNEEETLTREFGGKLGEWIKRTKRLVPEA